MGRDSKKHKKTFRKVSPWLINFLKWGVICSIGILVSYFIVSKLNIVNNLWVILITSFIVSSFVEMVRSHNHHYRFKKRWVFFYFLVYATIIWLINELFFSIFSSQNILTQSLIVGFILSSGILLIRSLRLKSNSLPWAYIILILILVVGNLSYVSDFIPSNINFQSNTSELSEQDQFCPTTIYGVQAPFILDKNEFNSISTMNKWTNIFINSIVWRKENDVSTCYLGKYQGQNPNNFYCDDLIVSRWELKNSGTINYRWYTAVSSEWIPVNSTSYSFNGFICENGQKVVVEKGVTNYYVYDSRSSGTIKIKY